MDEKFLKNYWLWVALIVIGGIFVFFLKFDLPVANSGQSYLILDFGNQNNRHFQGQVLPDMTILEALYSASVNGSFDFRYSVDKNGVLQIAKIGNAVNYVNGGSWHVYLNGSSIDVGQINNIKINKGDVIEAKYE